MYTNINNSKKKNIYIYTHTYIICISDYIPLVR